MGSLPGYRAVRRVSPRVSPVQLAWVGGLGLRRDRRYGRASDGSLDLGPRSWLPDDDRNAVDAVQSRVLPERDDDAVRVRGAQRQAASEVDLVRRRPRAAQAGGARRERNHESDRRRAVDRQQRQADARYLRQEPAPPAGLAAQVL